MASNGSDFVPSSAGHGAYAPFPVPTGPGVVRVEAGGALRSIFLLAPGEKAPEIPAAWVLDADAQAEMIFIVLPGADAELPLVVDLAGERAQVRLSGLFLSDGDDRVRIQVKVHHRCAECVSYQLFNGLLAGKAEDAFSGTIIVAPDAQRTEAYQENHNIVLSEDARMQTQPVLEIYADDVKCSHGATVGALDENELFYLRSRGIPREEARVLQMLSFLSPVLDRIPEEDGREALAARVEAAVRKLAAR